MVVRDEKRLEGKERADLRNAQLKTLVLVWEKKRDTLCDEIAYRRGQLELLEQAIKDAYEMILSVNKEEQQKELNEVLTKGPPMGIKTPKKRRVRKNPNLGKETK